MAHGGGYLVHCTRVGQVAVVSGLLLRTQDRVHALHKLFIVSVRALLLNHPDVHVVFVKLRQAFRSRVLAHQSVGELQRSAELFAGAQTRRRGSGGASGDRGARPPKGRLLANPNLSCTVGIAVAWESNWPERRQKSYAPQVHFIPLTQLHEDPKQESYADTCTAACHQN
eukprot:1168622-Rhodomonas_salina.2